VQVANCYFWTALSGLIGARVLYVLTNWHELEGPLEVLDFRSGGLVAYGGFLGGLAGSLWYARRRGLAWLTWADAAVPSVAAGLALTRLGCYAFGCDFGKPLPAAAPSWLKALGTFPHWPDGTLPHASGAPAWVAHVNGRGLPYDSPASMAVHPTQLYESLLGAALLALLLWAWPRRRFQGELLLLFWLGYGVGRFLLELLRDDPERGAFGPLLSPLALIGVALLAFGGAYALGPARLQRQPRLRLAGLLGWPLGAAALYALLVSNEAAAAQLSTSQWVSVFSALVAGAAWTFVQRLSQAVGARPDSVPAPHP
jgi:phosphatidylglycerol:prolipoprotein diacylglycerol transferase